MRLTLAKVAALLPEAAGIFKCAHYSGCTVGSCHAWTKCIMQGITEQLRLEGISELHLVQSPLAQQGPVVHSTQAICKLNNPITYCELTMQLN